MQSTISIFTEAVLVAREVAVMATGTVLTDVFVYTHMYVYL